MPWKVTILFPNRPIITGDKIYLENSHQFTIEHVDENGKLCAPNTANPASQRTHNPYEDREVVQPLEMKNRPRGHAPRSQVPSGSFPTFDVPRSDGSVAQAVIDDADQEGYAAYMEANPAVSPAEAMSPYPAGSLCDRAWKNGYARADHCDVRDDDDGV